MKLSEIHFKPFAIVEFSTEELDLLCEWSAKHYDAVCKAASTEGGFLFGLRNCETNAPGHTHQLDFRQLDTLAKIAEVARYLDLGNGIEKALAASDLNFKLRQILRTLNDVVPAPVFFGAAAADTGGAISDDDEVLVKKSIELMKQERKISTSLVQRRLGLGYTHSHRVMMILEERGFIAKGEGAGLREILIDLDAS